VSGLLLKSADLALNVGLPLATLIAEAVGGYSLAQIIVFVIVIAAIIAIAMVAIRVMGIAIPYWVIQIFWIVVIAVVAIFAIKFLLASV